VQPVGDERKQAGLAGAVAADEADLLARLQRDAGACSTTLVPRRRVMLRSVIMGSLLSMSSTWSSPALVGSQTTGSAGKAASKWARSWPISSTSTPWG
jgi:hypothetical protein